MTFEEQERARLNLYYKNLKEMKKINPITARLNNLHTLQTCGQCGEFKTVRCPYPGTQSLHHICR